MKARKETGRITRRGFLGTGAAAGAGLVLGVWIPGCGPGGRSEGRAFRPNVWLSVGEDGAVTVTLARTELGQGVLTALPLIVADELGASWDQVRVIRADADREAYGDQTTGGSRSVRTSWDPLRRAAAAAREMLEEAAAERWGVPVEECRTAAGRVSHPESGRSLPFAGLAEAAGRLPVPGEPALKRPEEHTLLGRPTLRLDAPAMVTGEAVFGMDVRVPGMLYAVLARPPGVGATLDAFDAAPALEVRDVSRVERVGEGVAVVAGNTWAAMKGRDRLQVSWKGGPNAGLDSASIERQFREAAAGPGVRALEEGDAGAALQAAHRVVEAVYDLPFLAHAPMEPANCTASVTDDRCEVWAPTQAPHDAREAAAQVSGLPRENVTVHVTLAGGAFGRRLMVREVAEAVGVSMAVGAPVKVVYTREDDIRHDSYRPGSRHVLKAGLDRRGRVMALKHRVVAPSIGAQLGGIPEGTLDEGAVSGAREMPYAIPNLWVDYVMSNTPVPIGWFRSVYDYQTAFANESFIDELAHASGAGPLELRRQLLKGRPRHLGVLDLAAEKAGWGRPAPEGIHRGIAVHGCFRSYAANVVELAEEPDGSLRIRRVVSAIDCGRPLNPLGIRAQIEGGVVFGLTAALKGEITLEGGAVRQGNFDDYPLVRMDEAPVVEAHIVPSRERPTGAGEPPVPPVAPALANAVFAATGRRIRRLPLSLQGAGAG